MAEEEGAADADAPARSCLLGIFLTQRLMQRQLVWVLCIFASGVVIPMLLNM